MIWSWSRDLWWVSLRAARRRTSSSLGVGAFGWLLAPVRAVEIFYGFADEFRGVRLGDAAHRRHAGLSPLSAPR